MKKVSYLLAAMALIFTSCTKDDRPAPPPPPTEVQLARSFYYPTTTESIGVSYSPREIQASIHQIPSENNLTFYFGVPFPEGNDVVLFSIPNSKLKQGYVGEYSIVSGANASSGDVKAQYNYLLTASAANLHLPGMAEGKLTITSYDEKHKMLSGNYRFEIISNQDPMVGIPASWKDNKITITGSFKNVVIFKQ